MRWLKVESRGTVLGVDREAGIIHGVILAEEGPFKSEGRGEFDAKSIQQVVALGKASAAGLKSRFTHPDLSSDGLGKYLGRVKDVRHDVIDRNGTAVSVARGDLHISPTAHDTPNGNLAKYVMDLTQEDHNALGMSLVVGELEEEYRLNKDGTAVKDANGYPLPPLWRLGSLHGVDVVDVGDATNSMLGQSLSIDGLPDEIVRKASALLRSQFAGKDRSFVESRLRAYVDRVLSHYWPVDDDWIDAQDLRRRLTVREFDFKNSCDVT